MRCACYAAIGALLLSVATLSAAPAAAAQPSGSERIFRTLILKRIAAYGRGDVATYMALLADGFVHISDLGERRTKPQMRAFVGGHGNNHASYTISQLAWRIVGGLAIVDAAVGEHEPGMEGGLHETDIFTWHDRRWLYLAHQETAVLQAPVAVPLAGERLDDYVGRYRTATGAIDVISAKHQILFDQSAPGDAAAPLVHVARGAFGFAGDPTLLVFLRDPAGKVTQCLWYLPSGQTIISRRVAR